MSNFQTDKTYRDDEMTVEGFWWPHFGDFESGSNDIHKAPGELSFDPLTGAKLKLYTKDRGLGWHSNVIWGEGGFGFLDKNISCFGVRVESVSSKVTTLHIDFICRGIHLSTPNDRLLTGVNFTSKNLIRWISQSGFEIDENYEEGSFNLKYVGPRSIGGNYSNKTSIEVNRTGLRIPSLDFEGEIKAKESVRIHLRNRDDHCSSFFEILESVESISNFFTIACGDLCSAYGIYVACSTRKDERSSDRRNKNRIRSNFTTNHLEASFRV